MDKGRIEELVDNPELVPGIYNYCDRWCERCSLTARCAVFAMEQAEADGSPSNDPENKAFWQRLNDTLSTALELLSKMAQEAGVHLDTLVSEEGRVSNARTKKEAGEHTLVRQATEYMNRVREWFKSTDLKVRLQLVGVDSKQEGEDFRNIEQVILWYHTLICIKITRAIQQEIRGCTASVESIPKDSDGSAKVALIAIDRSIAAWWRMRAYFPQRKEQILDFLVRLDRLQRATERAFPKGKSFVRPGFDEA